MTSEKCKLCGTEFIKKSYQQIFCSKECTQKSKVKRPKVEKTCKTCGKTYFVYPYMKLSSKYCSYKCAGIGMSTQVEIKCRFCGNSFVYRPSQSKHYKGAGKYCSRECSYKGIIEEHKDYPVKYNGHITIRHYDKLFQKAVRERDKNICRKCGKYEKYIHAHHLVLRSQSQSLRYEPSNGICLCISCHMWVHHHPKEACSLGLLKMGKYPQQ